MKFSVELFSEVIDPEVAVKELRLIEKHYVPVVQHGPYHDGNWRSIPLFAANGDMQSDALDCDANYSKTEAIKLAPNLEAMIDAIPGEKKRVRLLSLPSGAKIYEHIDATDSVDSATCRLHLPKVTHDDVVVKINNSRMKWVPGNIYYGDFSFPHSVMNNSPINRVHLVIDVVNNGELKSLILEKFNGELPTKFARNFARLMYKVRRRLGLVMR